MLVVRAVCTGCKTEHQCYWGAGWGPQPGWVTGSGLQLCPNLDRVGPEGPSGVKQAGCAAPPSSVLLQAVGSGSWHQAAAGEQWMFRGCPKAAISCSRSALQAVVSPDNALSAAGQHAALGARSFLSSGEQ